MPYLTAADFIDRFGLPELVQLTTPDPAAADYDPAVFDRAVADADAEIDSYLAARYPLPLAAVPPVLTRIAADITRYRLWNDQASDEVRTRYEDARRLLENLARGTVSLGLPAADAPRPSLAAAHAGNAPVFDRANTGAF